MAASGNCGPPPPTARSPAASDPIGVPIYSPASDPSLGPPLDDPALGQENELADIGPLDDLDVDLPADTLQSVLEFQALVAAVGIQLGRN